FVQTADDAQAPAVVGDRQVLQALRLRCTRHLLDAQLPVAPGRVRLHVAFQVFQLDQCWQAVLARGLDLAGRFPQFGRNPVQPKALVDLRLTRTEYFLLSLGEAVFVERITLRL